MGGGVGTGHTVQPRHPEAESLRQGQRIEGWAPWCPPVSMASRRCLPWSAPSPMGKCAPAREGSWAWDPGSRTGVEPTGPPAGLRVIPGVARTQVPSSRGLGGTAWLERGSPVTSSPARLRGHLPAPSLVEPRPRVAGVAVPADALVVPPRPARGAG